MPQGPSKEGDPGKRSPNPIYGDTKGDLNAVLPASSVDEGKLQSGYEVQRPKGRRRRGQQLVVVREHVPPVLEPGPTFQELEQQTVAQDGVLQGVGGKVYGGEPPVEKK